MIAIVVGTNRENSLSKKIAELYQELLNEQQVHSYIVDLALLPEDFAFSALYSNNGKNAAFNVLRDQINAAQKYVFVVPEYNGSFPGVLKTFIDGFSYPNGLLHKKAALVGISSGVQGGALALSHLNDVFNYLGMNILAQRVKIPLLNKNFVDGNITDTTIEKLVHEQVKLFINF
jgi:chromate reductase, NAD(P)H dehydrogenase (quinone)